MKNKNYLQPALKWVEAETTTLLATSGDSSDNGNGGMPVIDDENGTITYPGGPGGSFGEDEEIA